MDPGARPPRSGALLVAGLLFLTQPAGARAVPGPPSGAAGGQEAPERRVVPVGTRLVVELHDSVSTRGTRVGRSFTAEVARGVDVPGGTAIPRGALLYFTPVRLEPSGSAWESAVVRVRFDSLAVGGASRPVRATLVRWHSERSSRIGTLLSIVLMLAAAGVGGLAGRWLVGRRGVLTGAALAAVAVAVYLTIFQPVDTVLPAGSQMEIRLEREVVVPAPGTPEG